MIAAHPQPSADRSSRDAGWPRSPTLPAERALTTFAFLWAFAALFHQAAYPGGAVGLSALMVTLPAIWVLLRPSSLTCFSVALTLQVVQVARFGLASASNHWLFTTFVNLTILLALTRLLLRHRGRIGDVDRSELFREFAPAVRLELVILYFFAVLHKLNGDFLNPVVSCATDQYAKIAVLYPLLPEGYWVAYAAIYGTLVVEALIPILLCIRRTRLAGLLLGAFFHFGLALNPDAVFFDFSSMLFAAFFLFLPYDYWGALRALPVRSAVGRRVRSRVTARRASFVFQRLAITLGVALVAAYLLRLVPDDRRVINIIQECVRLFWVLYGAGLIVILLLVARSTLILPAVRGLDTLALPRVSASFLPALLFLNGLSPYLGLKTEASFAMFSNLRTEAGRWNHLFIPPQLKVAAYQDDVVQVVESSNRSLQSVARRKQLLTHHDFRTRTSGDPDASVTYRRNGELHRVARVADDRTLATPPALWERQLLRFRAIDPPGRRVRCRH